MTCPNPNMPGTPGHVRRPYAPSLALVPLGVAAELAGTTIQIVRNAILAGDVAYATIKGAPYADLDSLEDLLQRRSSSDPQ